MFKILIVEDDSYQRKNLINMLTDIDGKFHILEANSVSEAIAISSDGTIDLFFIDVGLGEYSGLELAKHIRSNNDYKVTWIIFVTTHVKYILEAFKEIHCYDYILKPYDKEQIHEVISTFTGNVVPKALVAVSEREYGIFDIDGVFIKLFLNEIIFAEVYRRTCYIHTNQGVYTIKNLPLKSLKEVIKSDYLVQSHKSYIVNLRYVKEVSKSIYAGTIYFDNYKETALVGEKFRNDFVRLFKSSNSNICRKQGLD